MSDRKIKYVTPAGVAVYPRLNEPDTKYKKEGEYSVKLRFKPSELPAEWLAQFEALLDESFEQKKAELIEKKHGAKAKSLTRRDVVQEEMDRETGEPTGYVTINCKMKASGISKAGKPWSRKPVLFDAARNTLDPAPAVWGGSVLKVAGEAMTYYAPNDNIVGVTFYLNAVQVLKLVTGGGGDASSFGFGEEEGFTAEPSAGAVFDDTSAESGDEF